MVELGKPVPEFQRPANGGRDISLSSLKGKNIVIYFYPKDNTPGCTKEGEGFRDAYPEFQAHDTEILGVSKDSVKKHENFAAKYNFPFPLLADEDETLCRIFDVIKEKNMYGRTFQGIERSTFVIDKAGNLAQTYRKVKVKGHVDEVLNFVKSL